jgi:transposase
MAAVLGIDVAKATFTVTLRTPDGKHRHKTCPNTPAGCEALGAWLSRQHVTQVHACLEATGTYGDALATWLFDAGHQVSVVNPAVIHAYARVQLARSKTDALDADLIAQFTATQQPPLWAPPAPEIRALQALVRRLDALYDMHTQESNRLATATVADVRASIEAVRDNLDGQIAHVKHLIRDHIDRHPGLRQQRELLTSIPGIGEATAAVLIAELFDKPYTSARQAAAFAGLVPRLHESGTLRGRPRLSKIGPGRVRKALYFPAMTALRFNPTIRAVRARLAAAGKPKMVIIGAAMRHLVHLAYGVLKSRQAYRATYSHS